MGWDTDFFEAFFTSLVRQQAWRQYDHRTAWTEAATRAQEAAARTLPHHAKDFRVAARHLHDRTQNDPWGRSEYFTVDVTGYDYDSNLPPVLVAEHENVPFRARIEYTTWKLVSIRSSFRVLVGYYRRVTSRSAHAIRGADGFFEIVSKVYGGSGVRGPMLAIAGDWDAGRVRPGDLRKLFEHRLISGRGR